MRAASVLKAGNELKQDAVDAVAKATLIPLHLVRMFLALVEQQGLHVVAVDGVSRQVEVTIADGLEDAEALATTAPSQKDRLCLEKGHDPGVALGRRLLLLHVCALLRQ